MICALASVQSSSYVSSLQTLSVQQGTKFWSADGVNKGERELQSNRLAQATGPSPRASATTVAASTDPSTQGPPPSHGPSVSLGLFDEQAQKKIIAGTSSEAASRFMLALGARPVPARLSALRLVRRHFEWARSCRSLIAGSVPPP